MDNKPQEYTVEWSIGGIYAENPADAVVQALGIMRDPESTATHFRVIGEGVDEFRDFADEFRISINGASQYVLGGGVKCPHCHSLDIAGGFVEVEAGSAYQSAVCSACGKSWKDIYKLVAYEEDGDE